jgi:meiotically up-regulated gene 157 (Mug157) protein
MYPKTEKRIAAKLAKILAMVSVRNTFLETLHDGETPKTRTGDFSDVKVIDGEGQEIPWKKVSKITDDEMKALMKQVVDRIYTWHLKSTELSEVPYVNAWIADTLVKYDDPELDSILMGFLERKWEDVSKEP